MTEMASSAGSGERARRTGPALEFEAVDESVAQIDGTPLSLIGPQPVFEVQRSPVQIAGYPLCQ